jgi:uncharacterized protein (DUF2126 family)
MGPSAETTAALSALLRAVVAMLTECPCDQPLINWGDELHGRFSLPLYLHADLKEVLADLECAGLGLGDPITEYLMRDGDLLLTGYDLGASRLELRRALEFWPLVGDSATQEGGGSRLVDASTYRIELRLRSVNRPERVKDWRLTTFDWAVPLQEAEDESGPVCLVGLRYRSFVPRRGLHPTLAEQAPVSLTLSHPHDGDWRITVHHWDPSGNAYPGLPKKIADARARRSARCVLEPLDVPPKPGTPPRDEAIGKHVVDLRWR